MLGIYCIVVLTRPLPAISATSSLEVVAGQSPTLAWPAKGQAALGAVGYGLLETHGAQKAAPIASTAKVITALAVLSKKPILAGDQGPTITLGLNDVEAYRKYVSLDGSSIPVENGEKLTQYQALEALLLPSANNIAYSLAVWAFGSLDNYLSYTNEYIKTLGLTQTHLADASGFSSQTTGTARDLTIIALKATEDPIISRIVAQKQAAIPVVGTVNNTNWLLGVDDITGIKTGHTDEADGCFIFSAKKTIDGQAVDVVGAVIGASNLQTALNNARALSNSSSDDFGRVTVVKAGGVIGSYKAPWGEGAQILAKNDLSSLIWKGSRPTPAISIEKLSTPGSANQIVGKAKITVGSQTLSTDLLLAEPIPRPPSYWRLLHPFSR